MYFCGEDEALKFIKLRENKEAYRQRKKHLAELTAEVIEKKFAELKGKIKCLDVWTPATYHRYIGSEIGSYMSFAFSSKYLPVAQTGIIPSIKNVTLATQWQNSPGGLPIAASAGKHAIEFLVKHSKKYFKNPSSDIKRISALRIDEKR